MNNQIKIKQKQSVSRNLWLDKIRGELFQAELVLAPGLGDVHLAGETVRSCIHGHGPARHWHSTLTHPLLIQVGKQDRQSGML